MKSKLSHLRITPTIMLFVYLPNSIAALMGLAMALCTIVLRVLLPTVIRSTEPYLTGKYVDFSKHPLQLTLQEPLSTNLLSIRKEVSKMFRNTLYC